MNETVILGLWSARKTLADCKPLSKEESSAIKTLLDSLLEKHVPTPQEVKRYAECKDLLKQCNNDNQRNYFLPTIEQFENKYALVN